MERILLMDEQNYDEGLPEIRRNAVRGVIFIDDKLLMIRDKYGELKLPGGGQDPGETDLDTLIREVHEETGCTVIPGSMKPFGYIEEKRLSTEGSSIWHHFSYIYFCDIGTERGDNDLSESEKSLGMRTFTCTIDEAIRINGEMLNKKGEQAWNRREYKTLLLLKEHFDKQ